MENQQVQEIVELEKKLPDGAFSTYDLEVLIPEVKKLKAGDIFVEIGVDKGRSLTAAYLSNSLIKIYGVDIKPRPLDLIGIEFTYIQSDSHEAGMNWKGGEISLLHIDGDHSYDGIFGDIRWWYSHMKKDGVMLFHDCDESSVGVMRAVTEFVDTHDIKSFKLYKRTDRNTSMARVEL